MFLLLLSFFFTRLLIFFPSLLSRFYSMCMCACVCVVFLVVLTSEHHKPMSCSMFVIRRTTRQRNRHRESAQEEKKNEKANYNVHCLCTKRYIIYIVGFIDICLPDINRKGKMVNVYHTQIDLLHHMINIPVRDLLISVE